MQRARRLVLAMLALVPAEASAIEQLGYEVERTDGPFEVRRIAAHVVAETVVEAPAADAGAAGFRILVDYIGGANRERASIAMTAPVTQEAGVELAMTAPVTQEPSGGAYRVSFVMPAEYTLDTLPEPTDPRVRLVAEPARRAAVVRYGGTWSQARYERHLEKLRAWIEREGLAPSGAEPVWARYDPPFMPWFLRRNEIWLELAP